jgi:predicted Zn-dependent protease
MITIWDGGGLGYAATTDLSEAGLAAPSTVPATGRRVTAGSMVTTAAPTTHATGTYVSPVEVTWDTLPLDDRLDLLQQQSRLLGIDDRIVNWGASLVRRDVDQLLLTRRRDGATGRIEQRFRFVYPSLNATANEGTNTQTRTFGGHAFCGQGGAEVLGRYGFGDAASPDRRAGARTAHAPTARPA